MDLSKPEQEGVPLLDRELLNRVLDQGEKLSIGSWEISTLLQARLELDNPEITPFGANHAIQPPASLTALPGYLTRIARDTLLSRPTADEFSAGRGKVLCRDDAAGDPASLGIACLLYGLAEGGDVRAGRMDKGQILRVKGISMLEAVKLEIDFLEGDACKTEDGAISHRLNHLSLWADFVYMVPPFYAYYGLLADKRDEQIKYFQAAYDQCRLYRKHLRRDNGLWKHIIFGPDKIDPWPWATSNGWAAAGMLRVFATLRQADEGVRDGFKSQRADLAAWAQEIVEVTAKNVDGDGMVRGYIDEPDFEGESCGTALLAYSAYRLAQYDITQDLIPFAEKARQAVYKRIKPDGLLNKVCDIFDERKWRETSAEGQSFVVLLEAGARDYWRTQGRAM